MLRKYYFLWCSGVKLIHYPIQRTEWLDMIPVVTPAKRQVLFSSFVDFLGWSVAFIRFINHRNQRRKIKCACDEFLNIDTLKSFNNITIGTTKNHLVSWKGWWDTLV